MSVTPRENSIAFSLTEGMSGSGVKEELNSSTDTMDLQLDTKDEDNFDDEVRSLQQGLGAEG